MSTAAGENRHKVREGKLKLALRKSGLALEDAVQKGWEISVLGDSHK